MTTDDLIDAVITRALLPTEGEVLYGSKNSVLTVLSSVLKSEVFPMYLELSNSHYLTYDDVPMALTLPIPEKAHHSTLLDVKLLHADGRQENIPRLPLGLAGSTAKGFLLEGEKLRFYGFLANENQLVRLYYHQEPHKLTSLENSLLIEQPTFSKDHEGNPTHLAMRFKGATLLQNSLFAALQSALDSDEIPLRLLFQSKANPLLTISLKVLHIAIYPNNPEHDMDVELVFWLSQEESVEIIAAQDTILAGGYITIQENETEVVMPQVPLGGEDLLIDKAALQMPISIDVRSRLSAAVAEKMARLERIAVRRVHYETQSLTPNNPLWS